MGNLEVKFDVDWRNDPEYLSALLDQVQDRHVAKFWEIERNLEDSFVPKDFTCTTVEEMRTILAGKDEYSHCMLYFNF